MSDESKCAVVLVLWSIAYHAGMFIAADKDRHIGFMLMICSTIVLTVFLLTEYSAQKRIESEIRRRKKYEADCAKREIEVRNSKN